MMNYRYRSCLVLLILLACYTSSVFAQDGTTVTGTVTDSKTGNSLPGVNISVKGTTIGTSTGSEGDYSLTVPSLKDTLVFSFIGYKTEEILIDGEIEINIQLQQQAVAGEELVVIGYGQRERRDLTGSISSINSEDFVQGSSSTLDGLLNGKVAGVQIVQNTGAPGGGNSVSIRGTGSINASNAPLYVVDGLPIDNNRLQGNGVTGFVNNRSGRSPLSTINPDDIESIEVLKDASATAIYGSRGANGVILITTKRGISGEMQGSYNGYVGIQNTQNRLDLLTPQEYKLHLNQIIDTGGGDESERIEEIVGEGTDWQDEIYRENVPVFSHNLSLSGGNESTTYRISLGNFNQEGLLESSAFKRYQGRINLNHKISEKIDVGFSLNSTYAQDDFSPNGQDVNERAGAINAANNYDPSQLVRNEGGNFITSPYMTIDNPRALTDGKESISNANRTFGSFYMDYYVLPELHFKVNLGGDVLDEQRDTYLDRQTISGRSQGGIGSVINRRQSNYLIEGTATYETSINENHVFDTVFGVTFQDFEVRNHSSQGSGFPSDATKAYNMNLADASTYTVGSFKSSHSLASYLGRLNYILFDKYLFTGSIRIDGSSRFGTNNKFGTFPSGAIGWKIDEEGFFESIKHTVSQLKLRASWGITGNQGIGNNAAIPTFGSNGRVVWDDELLLATSPSRLANPNLKWEKTKQIDIGFDFGLFNQRINGSFDYYRKNTEDLLLQLPIPTSSGFNTQLTNIGRVINSGLELGVNAALISRESFIWNFEGNFSTLKNEVKDLGGIPQILRGSAAFSDAMGLVRPGEPLDAFFGYEVDGIWQEGDDFSQTQESVQPGSIKYVDQNGDGNINDADRVILGDSYPDIEWSLGNNFSFKDFELYFLFQGVEGIHMFNAKLSNTLFPFNFRRNRLANPILNRWTPENPSNLWPSFADPFSQGTNRVNSLTVQDASYWKLSTIRLSYHLPPSIIPALRSVTFYLTAQNIFTVSDYDGVNPEVNSNGNTHQRIDWNTYPLARTFLFGLNLDF